MKMKKMLVGAAAALMLSGAAHASLLPAFVSSSAVGPNTSYVYSLDFGTVLGPGGVSDERLEAGDFVTIYDISGLVYATAPALWSVSAQNSGVNAFGTAPTDDPTTVNITFTYTGPTVTVDTLFPGAEIVSSIAVLPSLTFTSETTNNTLAGSGSPVGHIGTTPTVIPEPATAMLGLLGAVGLLGARRRG